MGFLKLIERSRNESYRDVAPTNPIASGLPAIRSESPAELLWQKFSHLQHGMVILFVRELTRDLPPVTEVELHGDSIRPNDAEAARLVSTGSYLGFALRE
jgi:hypothetical protein